MSDNRSSMHRPVEVLFFFVLPALILALLVLVPPHGFDLRLSGFFFDGEFTYRRHPILENVLHDGVKLVPYTVAFVCLLVTGFFLRAGNTAADDERRLWATRAIYVFLTLALSLALVTFLKALTNVACPWSLTQFGGAAALTDPGFHWGGTERCWPAGHATTGFALFSLYFAFRDQKPRLAALLFLAATLFGLVCGFTRIVQGAHFLSHVAASFLIDWLLAAGLYVAFRFYGARFVPGETNDTAVVCVAHLTPNTAALWAGVYFAFILDLPMWQKALTALTSAQTSLMPFVSELGVVLLCAAGLSFAFAAVVLLFALAGSKVFKTALIVLSLVGALAYSASVLYGVSMTTEMMENYLATDRAEATAYFSLKTVLTFLAAFAPGLVIALAADFKEWFVKPFVRRTLATAAFCTGFLAVGAALLMTQMQTLASTVRNNRDLRYDLAPVSPLVALYKATLGDKTSKVRGPRTVVDTKPVLTAAYAERKDPMLFVVVVGETTRAANWQASGYNRTTLPELSKITDVVEMPVIEACGTSTEVSLPCMLSRVGRRDYDRARIVQEESLPALLQRAGYTVTWIDNQSGCKGTCDGVESIRPAENAAYCGKDGCTDEVFLPQMQAIAENLRPGEKRVVFLHMIGSHGPRYYERSRTAVKHFDSECTSPDLGSCSRESIVNAYDNSLLTTDRVLAGVIETLKATPRLASGLIFMSDHGESLGEKGLYLHGAPYLIAPKEQTQVPGLVWLSDSWTGELGINAAVLRQNVKTLTLKHDHLYHTVLGLLGVQSSAYEKAWDLSAPQS